MDDERRVRIIGYPLELTTLAEDDKRYERLSRKIEDAHERGDMTVVLPYGIGDALLGVPIKTYRPVALVGLSEYPARVILRFDDVDSRWV